MEASRAKCGNNHPVILEIGATTWKKGLAFNIIKMVTSMRACGLWTRGTVKAHTGEQRAVNLGVSTQETGTKTKSMEEVLSFTKMEIDTTDTGSMVFPKAKDAWFTQTKTYTKDNGTKANVTDMESWPKEMETTSKVIGLRTNVKVRVLISITTKISFLLENGWKINLRLEFIRRLKMRMKTKAQRNLILRMNTSCQVSLN